ncbi:MAG: hypothetical protein QM305_09705 [Bacteroidota bacterium]|jgi:hypothetical protein|nr:hypothetical protein [Bacteroidota bacterium]
MKKELHDNYAINLERLLNEAYQLTKDEKLVRAYTHNPLIIDITAKGELRPIASEIYLISSIMKKENFVTRFDFKNEKFKRS